MTVLISGYLPSGNDESLKYEKTVPFEYISQVMEVMRWKKGENIEGEYPIKNDYVVRIEEVIGEKLPVGLEYFIGAVAGAECNTVIELKLEHHAA
ncbi:hypothetical protein KUU58_32075 [Pseudomonas aeruginosa]|nr:hypothetical protein [Pseudomonas aeruginosa]